MTSIHPNALRSTLQQLQAAPVADQAGITRALDAALADGKLSASERAALGTLVQLPADRFDAAATRERLQSLLAIPDDKVLALADKLTRKDGVLDIRDARAIADLIQGAGAGQGVASLRALMIGSKMTRGAERLLDDTARASGGKAAVDPDVSERAFKQASAANFTSLYWEDFAGTPTAARLCRQHGEAQVKAAFDRLATADANDGLSSTDAAVIARGPQPSSELERALAKYARQQLSSDYLHNRWGGFVPWSLADTRTQLTETLRKAGLACGVDLTGYTGKAKDWKINELTLGQLDAASWKKLQESPALQRALCKTFGHGVRWDSLHVRYDSAMQVARLATEAPGKLAAPAPLLSPADFITHHNQSLDSWQEEMGTELESSIQESLAQAEKRAAAEARVVKDLEAAGLKVHRVAGVYQAGHFQNSYFMNAEQGQNARGERFYIPLGGDPRAEKAFVEDLRAIDPGIARVHFLDRAYTQTTLSAMGGIRCRCKAEGELA